jgi:hypothetical protein
MSMDTHTFGAVLHFITWHWLTLTLFRVRLHLGDFISIGCKIFKTVLSQVVVVVVDRQFLSMDERITSTWPSALEWKKQERRNKTTTTTTTITEKNESCVVLRHIYNVIFIFLFETLFSFFFKKKEEKLKAKGWATLVMDVNKIKYKS